MKTSTQLTSRLKEVFLNGTWIANTNYKAILENVSVDQANQKVSSLNTILALTYHINYYLVGLNHFFKTGKLEISDKYSFDHPEVKSEEDWQKLYKDLIANATLFCNNVEVLSDEQLKAVFIDKKYGDYRRNIEGVIEHSYYHLGQISLIKKMISK